MVLMNKMLNKDMEKLAPKITKLLSAYGYNGGTCIYFNDKALINKQGKWIEREGEKGSDYCDYSNDETLTMTFEGVDSIYNIINGYQRDYIFMEEFEALLDNYGYYYQLGNSWNLTLYKI
jgi:hypothetical protein